MLEHTLYKAVGSGLCNRQGHRIVSGWLILLGKLGHHLVHYLLILIAMKMDVLLLAFLIGGLVAGDAAFFDEATTGETMEPDAIGLRNDGGENGSTVALLQEAKLHTTKKDRSSGSHKAANFDNEVVCVQSAGWENTKYMRETNMQAAGNTQPRSGLLLGERLTYRSPALKSDRGLGLRAGLGASSLRDDDRLVVLLVDRLR